MLVQEEVEKRYAAVVHKLIRRINAKLQQHVQQLLPLQQDESNKSCAADDSRVATHLEPLTRTYSAFFDGLVAAGADMRVSRRLARELWNAAAYVSGPCIACMHDEGRSGRLQNKSHAMSSWSASVTARQDQRCLTGPADAVQPHLPCLLVCV